MLRKKNLITINPLFFFEIIFILIFKMFFEFKFYFIFLFFGTNLSKAFDIDQYEKLIFKAVEDPYLHREFEKLLKDIQTMEPNYFDYNPFDHGTKAFDCQIIPPSQTEVVSVHQLRPSDIKVVGALGDSISAGLGINAKTIFGLLVENRGNAWSGGGKWNLEQITTMPNILKKYSSNLRGFSRFNNFAKTIGPNKNSLNVAVSGSEAHHMPNQARDLIKRIKNDKKIDFEKDWKLVTMFIGGNDLCDFCNDPESLSSPQSYVDFIREALDILHEELPRTFVNLVSMFHANELQKLNRSPICVFFHERWCPCAAFFDPVRNEQLMDYTRQYLNFTHSLIDSLRYDDRDDFTVVIQEVTFQFILVRCISGRCLFFYI
jgi:phospholipase B1